MDNCETIHVAHVVNKIKGVSIPIEIASAISKKSNVRVGLIPVYNYGNYNEYPDIVREDIVVTPEEPVSSYKHLVDKINQDRYDIVHTHHNRSSVILSFLLKYKDVVHVNTQHGHAHYTFSQKLINMATLLLCSNFTYNSKCTKTSYNWFENLLRTDGSHRVIHNGVDLDRLEPFRKSNYGDVSTLVTASRLIRRKNITTVLEALKSFPNLEFVIVGEGPLRETLQMKAREYGLSDRVEFAGFVQDREQVYRILSRGDAFVHPSFSEGFCVAVAEAMALGLPVIVSDIPVFHEVVGEAGLFVHPSEAQSLERTVDWLIKHPEEGEKRGRQNRERIRNRFNLDDVACRYVETYRSILKKREM